MDYENQNEKNDHKEQNRLTPNTTNRILDSVKNHSDIKPSTDDSNITNSSTNHMTAGKHIPEHGTGSKTSAANYAGKNAAHATGASGVGSAAGSAGATAAGATAGSIAPGIGTAIGAAVAKTADNAKKAKEASQAAEHAKIKSGPGSVSSDMKSSSIADTNIALRMVIGIVSILAAFIICTLILCHMMIDSVAAPIMAVFKSTQSAFTSISGFLGKEITYADIQSVFLEDLQDAFSYAYTDVCQDEVYQIALEKEYDIALTMESYNNTKFPYQLSGENCNINYAEIFNVLSLSDKWDFDNWKDFDYETFKELYEDKEFLRSLYTLQVEPAEKILINEAMLSEGDSCEIHKDKSVTITHTDGSTDTYTDESAEVYFDVIIYGAVTVSPYGLLEIFDYFEIDPYAPSSILPNMTNWKAMEYQEYFTRCYNPDVFWGTEERSKLITYEHLTGDLIASAGNMYIKDIFDANIITEDYVYYDVALFKQADPRWAAEKYLGKNMASYGCCVTSMAMVINYYGDRTIDPGILLSRMNREAQGKLNRPALSEAYGFWHYLDDNSFNIHSDLSKITGELINERLVIAHIKPNSSKHFSTQNGHWIVIHGFQRNTADAGQDIHDGSIGFFFINDPNRNNEIMTFIEAANLIDRIQSYGYRKD